VYIVNLLLDTHTFLWFIAGSERLSTTARDLIEDSASQPFMSAASLWEMAIKLGLGRLHLGLPFQELIPVQMRLNSI
jgi:PIN domain nuclease of toxin-antitoxin system